MMLGRELQGILGSLAIYLPTEYITSNLLLFLLRHVIIFSSDLISALASTSKREIREEGSRLGEACIAWLWGSMVTVTLFLMQDAMLVDFDKVFVFTALL